MLSVKNYNKPTVISELDIYKNPDDFKEKSLHKCDIIKQPRKINEELQVISKGLAFLVDDTLSELADAVFALDVESILALARDIEQSQPELAASLVTMVNNFDFKPLQELLKNHQG